VLAVQASAPLFLHPYEADGEPFRLLAGFSDETLVLIDPETGAVLHRFQENGLLRGHHTFETEDGRLILALSGQGGVLAFYDLGEASLGGATSCPRPTSSDDSPKSPQCTCGCSCC
jgi:hypothetical protein